MHVNSWEVLKNQIAELQNIENGEISRGRVIYNSLSSDMASIWMLNLLKKHS